MRPINDTCQPYPELAPCRSITIKVGSRIVADGDPAERDARVAVLATDIARLLDRGMRVVLVTSGAIAHGMAAMGMTKRPATIPQKQACASIGQSRLMRMYATLFESHSINVGQVLLTWDDLRDKKRYLNLRNTLFQLLDWGVLPVVNENDSVGVEEIRFGDNDTLGAQVAMLSGSDAYAILTDVNGLYDSDPRTNPGAVHIHRVDTVTEAVRALGKGAGSEISVGGMATKLKAAEMVTRAGLLALVGNGYHAGLGRVLGDADCATLFLPQSRKMTARSRWIAFAGKSRGRIAVDEGARRALVERGTSLLPAGIKECSGTFSVGDAVDIVSDSGTVVARGLSNYSSADISKIKGLRTVAITKLLGQKSFDEAVHRDNLVIL